MCGLGTVCPPRPQPGRGEEPAPRPAPNPGSRCRGLVARSPRLRDRSGPGERGTAEASGAGRGAPSGPCPAEGARAGCSRGGAEPYRAVPCILAALQQAPGPGHCLFLPEEGPSPALHNVLFQARLPAPPAAPGPVRPPPAAPLPFPRRRLRPLRPRPGPLAPLRLPGPPREPGVTRSAAPAPLPGQQLVVSLSGAPPARAPSLRPSVPSPLPAPRSEPRRRAGAGRQGPGPAPGRLRLRLRRGRRCGGCAGAAGRCGAGAVPQLRGRRRGEGAAASPGSCGSAGLREGLRLARPSPRPARLPLPRKSTKAHKKVGGGGGGSAPAPLIPGHRPRAAAAIAAPLPRPRPRHRPRAGIVLEIASSLEVKPYLRVNPRRTPKPDCQRRGRARGRRRICAGNGREPRAEGSGAGPGRENAGSRSVRPRVPR